MMLHLDGRCNPVGNRTLIGSVVLGPAQRLSTPHFEAAHLGVWG
jgi:hypothetical protein